MKETEQILQLQDITLRKYEESDVEHFMKWASDPEILRFSTHLRPWLNPNSSRQDFIRYFTQVVNPHPWYRVICFKDEPIGFICVEPKAPLFQRATATMSYAMNRDYSSRGIATSVTRMAVSAAFRDLPQLVRIEATSFVDNKASQRVLEKAGLVKEGLLRKYFVVDGVGIDVFLYSILSTDVVPHGNDLLSRL